MRVQRLREWNRVCEIFDLSQPTIRFIEQFLEVDAADFLACIQENESGVAQNLEEEDPVIYNKVAVSCDAIVEKGEAALVAIKSREARKFVRGLFRERVSEIYTGSKVLQRALDKPNGYPGDFLMMEFIYNEKPISSGIGKYLDLYLLRNPYAVAVRNRKNLMKEYLCELISRDPSQRQLKVLNLGCGSCREWREDPLWEIAKKREIGLICLDQDAEALKFSQTKLAENGRTLTLSLVNRSLLSYSRNSKDDFSSIQFDLIYSIGVADYLPDSLLKEVVRESFRLLGKGGRLVMAHKDRLGYNPLSPDWFCDWVFTPRSEKELLGLFREVAPPGVRFRSFREPTKNIFFTEVAL